MTISPCSILRRREVMVAGSAFAVTSSRADTESGPSISSVKFEVETIVLRFMKRAGSLLSVATPPAVVIEFTPELSWIGGGVMHEAAWVQCPPPFKAFIASLLGEKPPMSPELFFHETFNFFLVPHEMSHFADGVRNVRLDSSAHFETEIHANRVAVAYWLGELGGRERLTRFMKAVAVVEAHLPSPVPPGQDKVKYFNENYDKLGANPAAYGWYQFRMFLDAWNQREQGTFFDLLSRRA